ncbi:protein kinase [Haloferula chungangensis]|uniref:Protein kinase n=1 Tax=Haloferula chungangensis TaxID=1048331 RepID=A0ABW2LAJ4_9BACT
MSHETFKAPELEHLAELLPAYDFESFIAQGGMGAVYKATQRSLDRTVAIKILPREFGEDPEFRESFETEAKAMAKLNHPNLLGVYDYGDIEGMPYIVMEFVDGKSLYHSAWNKVIEPEQAIQIVRGICEGLGHAHEHGILHRDIKPANILLNSKAQPKIGDFGLAQQTDAAGTGEVMGTPGYAAPELIHSPDQAGIGTDIYAVGIILHELITGQRPDPQGIEKPEPSGDRGLDAIWQKATDPVISKRYQSAAEMAAALAAWKPSAVKLATGGNPAPRSLVVAPAPKNASSSTPAKPGTAPARSSSAPAGAGASRPVPQLVVPEGTNWSLARNMLIIAFLIAVIGFGFKMLQRAKKNSTSESDAAKKELFEKKQKAAAELKKQELTSTTDSTPSTLPPSSPASSPATTSPTSDPKPPVTPPPVTEIKESPAESLARLKDDLAKGNRDEMPKGSKRRGTNDYFIVETPMTWYAAQAFAEEHGAQLAILESSEELTWLSQILPDDINVWLGSGRAERNSWVDNDGSDWSLEEEPKGVGSFATLNKLGILRAGKVTDSLPFVIQWHRDGSNPGTLKTILERTRETLDTPNPIYPPGTISLGARQILFLPLPVNRSEAEALASIASGILAVPSSREEMGWIEDQSESLEASAGYWLGGQRKDGTWTWDSGEAWEKAKWIDDSEPTDGGDALILIPGKGWSNADPSAPAAGLVIEWSRDASTE